MRFRDLKYKFIPAAIIGSMVLSMASIAISFAWFRPLYEIKEENISGSVLKKYFHDGTGTQSDPFIITRPKHYENLVMLYYNMPGFPSALIGQEYTDEHGVLITNTTNNTYTDEVYGGTYKRSYYFQIGAKLVAGDDNYYVYNYDDDGKLLTGTSTELNLGCYDSRKPLEPLGSVEYPFISFIEGNGITLTNFQINGAGYCDIGVFGYVGEGGGANNLYFRDYTIDTTGATSKVENPSQYHKEHEYGANCYTGYIAGHVNNSRFFTDVYTNNCNIIGKTGDYPLLNNYSYYGMVDTDVSSAEAGSGKNYHFTLDSSAMYNYLNTYYDKGILPPTDDAASEEDFPGGLDDATMRVRNTEYGEVNDKTPPVEQVPSNPTSVSNPYPFNDGITKNTDADNVNSYVLNGTYTNASGTQTHTNSALYEGNRNYSISTLGYHGPKVEKEEHEYEVYYDSNGNGNYLMPDKSTTVSSKGKNELATSGYYYHYDNVGKKWEYIDSKNSSVGDKYITTISFEKFEGYYSDRPVYTTYYPQDSNTTITINLYIDDYVFTPTLTTGDFDNNDGVWQYKKNIDGNGKIEIELEQIQIENFAGYHHYSLVALFHWTFNFIGTWNEYSLAYFGASLDGGTVKQQSYYLPPTGITEGNTHSLNVSLKSNGTNSANESVKSEQIPFEPIVVVSEDTKVYNVKGIILGGSNEYVDLKYRTTNFYFEFDKWYAKETIRKVIKEESGPVYIGDDPDITSSGYNSENIDIVGGGITFNSGNITINAESSALTTTPSINETFYSTKYCPNSIVLYLKNVGGTAMGSISVNYTTIGALFGISLKAPGFKKGGSTYLQFSDIFDTNSTRYTHTDSGVDRTIAINDITPLEARKAAFCGIDKDRKVVALYDSSGTLTSGNEGKVTHFVLCLGINQKNDIWAQIFGSLFSATSITKIDFSFKADEGYGGTFGTVGYRTAPDRFNDITDANGNVTGRENTILNFYYIMPSGDYDYSISVNYVNSEKKYYVTIKANEKITVLLFLYNYTDYSLNVNGVDQPRQEQHSYPTSGVAGNFDYYSYPGG